MTRPPQPTEYPGNLPGPRDQGETSPPIVRRMYSNPLTGEAYSGSVWVFIDNVRVATVPLVDGQFVYDLPPGRYHLTAEVLVDGVTRYIDSEVIV